MVRFFFDSPTSPPFFFRRAEPPRGLHYNGDGKLFVFFLGEWREGDIRCSVPFDEALRMSNAVQLGSGPEGQGRGIRKL